MAEKMGPVSERKLHVHLLSERQFQTESSVVCGNTLHHTDCHRPWGIQGEIAQAGTGQGLSMCGCSLGEPETPKHILHECTKCNSIRHRLRESALIEGVAWSPQLDFWVQRGCYFAAYVGQDDVTETGRRATPQETVVIVRNRTKKIG